MQLAWHHYGMASSLNYVTGTLSFGTFFCFKGFLVLGNIELCLHLLSEVKSGSQFLLSPWLTNRQKTHTANIVLGHDRRIMMG